MYMLSYTLLIQIDVVCNQSAIQVKPLTACEHAGASELERCLLVNVIDAA